MKKVRLGVAGLGRAFTLMLPALTRHPRIALVAAADPRAEARESFERDFGRTAYDSIEGLVADRAVEAVYVATPHEHHAAHAVAAAQAGKHVLVEKPMALRAADARSMIDAAKDAGVRMIVGPSHSFDAPIARTRRLLDGGELGAVRMITAIDYTDFLYRPRRPEELDTERGGGVFFSQAAHQVDIVRLLAGSRARSVRAHAGNWDPARATEGAYGALIAFEDECFASLAYSAYGHFDTDELCGGIGELGHEKDRSSYGAARKALANVARSEASSKHARTYGGADYRAPEAASPWHEHFGVVVVSCERGDVRPLPNGLWIYGDLEKRFEPLGKPIVPRSEVIDELCDAIEGARNPLHDGEWGLATLEICDAMLRSARQGREISLQRRVDA